jgi:hypothetical protein
MFPNDCAAGSDVEVNNQQLATCCVRADADDTALARHGVLVHFAGFQHFTFSRLNTGSLATRIRRKQ